MPRRRAIVAALASTLVFAVLAALYAFVGNPFSPFDDRRFDHARWKNASPDARARMSKDLVTRYLPPGMSEPHMIALLGEPSQIEEGVTEARRRVGMRHLMYDLGHWGLHGMDAAYVYVHLDEKGNVVAAEVYGY